MPIQEFGDWDALERALNPAFMGPRLHAAVKDAHEQIGKTAVKRVKRAIQRRNYKALSKFTSLIKQQNNTYPLVEWGDLRDAITYKVPKWDRVFVGIPKGAKNRAGDDLSKVAAILHSGATVNVTDKMRRYMAARYGITFKASTKVLRIPARRFILNPLNNKLFIVQTTRIYRAHVSRAFGGRVSLRGSGMTSVNEKLGFMFGNN